MSSARKRQRGDRVAIIIDAANQQKMLAQQHARNMQLMADRAADEITKLKKELDAVTVKLAKCREEKALCSECQTKIDRNKLTPSQAVSAMLSVFDQHPTVIVSGDDDPPVSIISLIQTQLNASVADTQSDESVNNQNTGDQHGQA